MWQTNVSKLVLLLLLPCCCCCFASKKTWCNDSHIDYGSVSNMRSSVKIAYSSTVQFVLELNWKHLVFIVLTRCVPSLAFDRVGLKCLFENFVYFSVCVRRTVFTSIDCNEGSARSMYDTGTYDTFRNPNTQYETSRESNMRRMWRRNGKRNDTHYKELRGIG